MTQRDPPHPHLVSHPLRQAIRKALKPPHLAAGVLAAGLVGLAPATLAANFPATLELSALDGTNGFTINGNPGDLSGISVNNAGDVNGDGIDDLIIGATNADPGGRYFAGQSYVVFGRSGGFTSPVEISALDGTNGFTLNGINAGDISGASVSNAGDVNGDGIDDLLIGAWGADPGGRTNAGQSYVVFGSSSGFGPVLELSALDGTNGFAINGFDFYDRSGDSVSGAGDINGDGIDDLLIGAPYASPSGRFRAGQSYVVFGRSTGFTPVLELSALDGANGFTLNGINAGDISGFSVSNAGDINGDGIDDLLIGARLADPGGRFRAGQSYVVFGSSSGFGPALELSALDGTNGFTLNGINAYDYSGVSVSNAGDVNGDGLDDLLIGARLADPGGRINAGQSYVVFGRSTGFNPIIELSALDGTNGFALNGINADDRSGYSVSNAGDVNGDGLDDLLIGALYADPGGRPGAGQSYVVFGSSAGFGPVLDLSTLDSTNGFTLNGINAVDFSGSSVSGAGDMNGDRIDDLIIGAPFASPGGRPSAGQSYVVFGTPVVPPPPILTVAIDIKPGDKANCLNIDSHGVIPVAVLGSATFEVADINIASLSFAGLEVQNVRVKDHDRPLCGPLDVNRDRFTDLVCLFEDDLTRWSPNDGTATLTGRLEDGTSFEGSDTFCLVPKGHRGGTSPVLPRSPEPFPDLPDLGNPRQ